MCRIARLLGGIATVALLLPLTVARADEARSLREWSADLGSAEEGARARAIEALRTLPESRLTEVRARLAQLRNRRPESSDANVILTAFRRATGSRRADDLVDIAAGVPIVLRERRDAAVQLMAEPLLLLRALEAIGTTEALVLVPEVLRLDREVWAMEGKRVTLRHGPRIAAAVYRSRGHEDAAGRDWAKWSIDTLELESPGRVMTRLDPELIPDVLRAWGATRWMDSMPIVASFVGDTRSAVRDAARDALRNFGQNGIWQVREQWRMRFGERPNVEWSWRRTLDELEKRIDAAESAEIRTSLERARQSLASAALEDAETLLDRVLSAQPVANHRDVLDTLLQLGDQWLERGELERARRAFTRADRLGASNARARLMFVRAESYAARGLLDLSLYRAAAERDPSCERCVRVWDALRRAEAAPEREPSSTRWWIAALSALLCAAFLGWRAPRDPREREEQTSSDSPVTIDQTLGDSI